MKFKVRFGGAQLPVTPELWKNVVTIKRAIDWAAENKVEFLVTPEGSLSGYTPNFVEHDGDIQNLKAALNDVENYARERKVGLCLGTLMVEEEPQGLLKRNEIRFYDPYLDHKGNAYKRMIIMSDLVVPGDKTEIITLGTSHGFFRVGGLICNDMWGEKEGKVLGRTALYDMKDAGAQLCVHATNGFRGDDIGDESKQELFRTFHEATLRILTQTGMPIITVDSCNDIYGQPYDGPTSTPSGVIVNSEWVAQAPRYGEQYFYYDFEFNNDMFEDDGGMYVNPMG